MSCWGRLLLSTEELPIMRLFYYSAGERKERVITLVVWTDLSI